MLIEWVVKCDANRVARCDWVTRWDWVVRRDAYRMGVNICVHVFEVYALNHSTNTRNSLLILVTHHQYS